MKDRLRTNQIVQHIVKKEVTEKDILMNGTILKSLKCPNEHDNFQKMNFVILKKSILK